MNTKNIILLIVVVAVAVLLFWMWQQGVLPFGQQAEAPATEQGDTTAAVQEQLDAVHLGDLDAELQGIDTDLNSL